MQYRSEWPCLIITPSTARFHWAAEFKKWIESSVLDASEVAVVTSGAWRWEKDEPRVVIISYNLVTPMKDHLDAVGFEVVVADECHYLKNPGARRTKAILPMLQKARRAVLLSGTPALSRPGELFSQLNALDPRAWPEYSAVGGARSKNA